MLVISKLKSIKSYRQLAQIVRQGKTLKFMHSRLLTWIKLLISCFKLIMKSMDYGCLFYGSSSQIIKISICLLKIKKSQSFLTDNSKTMIQLKALYHLLLEEWTRILNGLIFMEKVSLALVILNSFGKLMNLKFKPMPNGSIF